MQCANNVSYSWNRGLKITTIAPSDLPLPVKQPTSVSVSLIFHKPGTWTPVEPYVKEHHKACYANDVYWYDSNNVIQTLAKAYLESENCIEGECVQKEIPTCVAKADKVCYRNNVVWIDSCGQIGEIYLECKEEEKCYDLDDTCKIPEGNIIIETDKNETAGEEIDIEELKIKWYTNPFILIGIVALLFILAIILIPKFMKKK